MWPSLKPCSHLAASLAGDSENSHLLRPLWWTWISHLHVIKPLVVSFIHCYKSWLTHWATGAEQALESKSFCISDGHTCFLSAFLWDAFLRLSLWFSYFCSFPFGPPKKPTLEGKSSLSLWMNPPVGEPFSKTQIKESIENPLEVRPCMFIYRRPTGRVSENLFTLSCPQNEAKWDQSRSDTHCWSLCRMNTVNANIKLQETIFGIGGCEKLSYSEIILDNHPTHDCTERVRRWRYWWGRGELSHSKTI